MSPEMGAPLRLAGAAALAAVLALVLIVSDATAHRAQVYTSHDQVAATAVLAGIAGARGRMPSADEAGHSDPAPAAGDAAEDQSPDELASPASVQVLAQVAGTSGTRFTEAVPSAAAPTAGAPRAPPAIQA